jgi:predicted protein tyrosine phosphatase
VPTDLTIHHVCGVDELKEAPLSSADRIVSILDPTDLPPPELASISVPVLTLRFADVIDAADGAAPRIAHVRTLLEFDAAARHDERLVIHCTAGISRSTAVLAVLLAARHPELDDEIFAAIREIRPRAWPNSRIVALGDEVLGRRERLVEALRRHYAFQIRDPKLGLMFRMWARPAEFPGD